jgi:hypothetical protein
MAVAPLAHAETDLGLEARHDHVWLDPDPRLAHRSERLKGDCALGENEACVEFGDLQREGIGMPESRAKAAVLYQLACSRGSESGCEKRDRLYADVEGFWPSLARYAAFHLLVLSGFVLWFAARRSRVLTHGPMSVESALALRAREARAIRLGGAVVFLILSAAPFALTPILTDIAPAQLPFYLASMLILGRLELGPSAGILAAAFGAYFAIVASFGLAFGIGAEITGLAGFAHTAVMVSGVGIGVLAGLVFLLATAPLTLRLMLDARPLRDADQTAKLRGCFRQAGLSSPDFYLSDALMPRAIWLTGLRALRPALFISRRALATLSPEELRAAVSREAAGHALHLVRARALGALLVLGICLAAGAALELVLGTGGAIGVGFLLASLPGQVFLWVATAKRQVGEADLHCVTRLGVEPRAFRSALLKLDQLSDEAEGRVREHAATDERIAQLEARFAALSGEEPEIAA